jgi:hypothetical protein
MLMKVSTFIGLSPFLFLGAGIYGLFKEGLASVGSVAVCFVISGILFYVIYIRRKKNSFVK